MYKNNALPDVRKKWYNLFVGDGLYRFDLTIGTEIYESSLRNEAVFILTILVELPKWYLYNVKDPVFLRGLHNNKLISSLMPYRRYLDRHNLSKTYYIKYYARSQ